MTIATHYHNAPAASRAARAAEVRAEAARWEASGSRRMARVCRILAQEIEHGAPIAR